MTRRARAPLDAGVGCWPPADAGTAWAGFVVRYVVDIWTGEREKMYGELCSHCSLSLRRSTRRHWRSIGWPLPPALMSLSCAAG